MRRLNDFSVAMTEVGMWAKVRIECNGDVIDGILGRCSDECLCLANNSGHWNGNYEFQNYPEWNEIISDYSNGWVILHRDCGALFLVLCHLEVWTPVMSSHLLVLSTKEVS